MTLHANGSRCAPEFEINAGIDLSVNPIQLPVHQRRLRRPGSVASTPR